VPVILSSRTDSTSARGAASGGAPEHAASEATLIAANHTTVRGTCVTVRR